MAVNDVTTEAGYIIVTKEKGGIPEKFAIADVLRAADIPTLTFAQVATITTLANITAILIRTLIERKILDEDFIDSLGMNWDLDHLIYAIEQMGGSYHEPDLDNV